MMRKNHWIFLAAQAIIPFLIFLTGCGDNGFQTSLFERQVPNNRAPVVAPPSRSLLEVGIESGIPERALRKAFQFFEDNKTMIPNKNYLTVVDFSKHSGEPRFFIMDLKTGQVESLLTAHGRGSDENNDGYADRFSNTPESKMSSIGFYLVAEPYVGKYGRSLRMDGLEKSNDKARARAVVIHGANYVDPSREKMGRSFGCPAVEMSKISSVVARLQGGSLFYAYHEVFSPNQVQTELADVQ